MCEICDELRQEGKLEAQEEIAFKMYKNNEPIEKIAKYTSVDLNTAKAWIKEFSKTIQKSCI